MPEVIGFYKETGAWGCFSNFYYAPFTFEDTKFIYAEQMIMWQKARLFGDTAVASEVLRVAKPFEAKRLGRKVTPYDDKVWSANRRELVVPGLYAKFEQNPDIRSMLLRTGDALIAECSPRDTIWGIGRNTWDVDINNPSCWRGTNLLGEYLMEVRDMLRKVGYTE